MEDFLNEISEDFIQGTFFPYQRKGQSTQIEDWNWKSNNIQQNLLLQKIIS
jgi:hypothetical protein